MVAGGTDSACRYGELKDASKYRRNLTEKAEKEEMDTRYTRRRKRERS